MNQQLYIATGVFVAAWFWLWSVLDVAIGRPGRFRSGGKRLWLPVVLLLPALGGALYLIAGRFVPVPPREISETRIDGEEEREPEEERPA